MLGTQLDLSGHWWNPCLVHSWICPVIGGIHAWYSAGFVLSLVDSMLGTQLDLSCHWWNPCLVLSWICPVIGGIHAWYSAGFVLSLVESMLASLIVYMYTIITCGSLFSLFSEA